jgi:hypothetical protein
MSKLIDALKKQSQAAPQPMGFRTSQKVEIPLKMMIIARVEKGAENIIQESFEGANAVLFRLEAPQFTAKTIQKTVKPLQDLPWGVMLEDDNGKQTAALVAAGCDFVVFSAASPVTAVPEDEKTGKILYVESSMDDGLLMTVNRLPVDAAMVSDTPEGTSLVWHQLMIYQHMATFINKPLIVPVPADISEPELKALWNAGIDAVMVDTDPAKAGSLKELGDIAAKLPPRALPKPGKVSVTLPRSAQGAQPEAPPDEEEEEEE